MICSVCHEEHDEKSGSFLKHIRNEHNITDKSEYYYMSHDSDLCIICNLKNKEIRTWSFEKCDTCESKECKKLNSNNKKRIGQINLYEMGMGNFQKQDVIEKAKATTKQQYLDGTSYCLRKDVREELSKRTTIRNLTNNPMKNKDTALRVSIAKTGVPLSESHRTNIGIALTNYLSNLSEEEFLARMLNTQRSLPISLSENILDNNTKSKLDNWLEHIEQHVIETKNILITGDKWKAATQYALDRGWEFVILTEKHLF